MRVYQYFFCYPDPKHCIYAWRLENVDKFGKYYQLNFCFRRMSEPSSLEPRMLERRISNNRFVLGYSIINKIILKIFRNMFLLRTFAFWFLFLNESRMRNFPDFHIGFISANHPSSLSAADQVDSSLAALSIKKRKTRLMLEESLCSIFSKNKKY